MKSERIGKYLIEVEQDNDPQDPRGDDNLGTMVCFHRNYNLGDKHDYDKSTFDNWKEIEEHLTKEHDVCVILPLYLYDHSGITMNTTGFNYQWDSMKVGFIYISKEKVRKEYNVKRINKKLKERITDYLIGEVSTYDQFLTGDVYGYSIYEIKVCELGHEHKIDKDSCWGFYGEDECMKEAKSIVKYYLESDNKIEVKEEEVLTTV